MNDNLMEYFSQILAEHEELDPDRDDELLTEAARILEAGENHGCKPTVDEALADARAVLSGELEERSRAFGREMEQEAEYCGIKPLPMDELLSILRREETYEPGEKEELDPIQARIARIILERQAESLKGEPSVEGMRYFIFGRVWCVAIRFQPGTLSREAQLTLAKMKHNAPRTIMCENGNLKVIRFIVVG
jgi:hypothetical protein